MAIIDPVTNLAKAGVSIGYDDADTEIDLDSGDGALLPATADGAYNLVWWNFTDFKDPSDDPNVEIVRVTVRATDTLTITRAQEGTGASTKNTGSKVYKMILAPTKKTVDDIRKFAMGLKKGVDIASATTTDIGAATGSYVEVTGTTTITGLGTVTAGVTRKVRFIGILTLTHNGTSLILPTAANITTAANDRATFVSLGSGNWICTDYQRADGTALAAAGGGGTLETAILATTRAGGEASGTEVIAHGLGGTPDMVIVNSVTYTTSGGALTNTSNGGFDGSTNNNSHLTQNIGSGVIIGTNGNAIYFQDGGTGTGQRGTISVDGTNVTITWTKSGAGMPNTIAVTLIAYRVT